MLANKAMRAYFITTGHIFRGRQITTIPVMINKDLSHLSEKMISLKPSEHLNKLISIYRDRKQWKTLSNKVKEAVEAALSDDQAVTCFKLVSQSE